MDKVLIIAEAGVNHNGDINLALELVRSAAKAKADYVKFQTFKADKIVTKSASQADYQKENSGQIETQYEMLKRLELNHESHHILQKECSKNGIKFLSTAFDEESADFLNNLGIDFFKVPSGEITNYFLLTKIASFGKPVILSTGMSTLDDIAAALDVLIKGGINRTDITVLHCNTQYPTPFADVNLKAMETIRDKFDVRIGYSDHTMGVEVSVAAVALGATIIEKHFTLDRTMKGPDHAASLEPDELTSMIEQIRNIEVALGSGVKQPSQSEHSNMIVARKSMFLAGSFAKGHVIGKDDVVMKRPGDGMSPMLFPAILGRSLKTDLPKDHQIRLEDLQ